MRTWNPIPQRQRLGKLRLLHAGVEIDVDRPFGRRVRDPGGAYERLAGGGRRGGLVVPFGEVAYERDFALRLTLEDDRVVRIVVMPGGTRP